MRTICQRLQELERPSLLPLRSGYSRAAWLASATNSPCARRGHAAITQLTEQIGVAAPARLSARRFAAIFGSADLCGEGNEGLLKTIAAAFDMGVLSERRI